MSSRGAKRRGDLIHDPRRLLPLTGELQLHLIVTTDILVWPCLKKRKNEYSPGIYSWVLNEEK
ncbi:hypothetical protein IIC38_17165 [candidate division KSB1 bacterium]|nr:hypothetical protein [candidate division KSB1 bacterium]